MPICRWCWAAKHDDPWRDAYRERIRVAKGEIVTVFDMLDRLLARQ